MWLSKEEKGIEEERFRLRGGSLAPSSMGRVVASLFLAFVLAISPLPASVIGDFAFADAGTPATAAYVAEEFDVVQDRVTFTCETAVDGTAEIACIVAESGVTKV